MRLLAPADYGLVAMAMVPIGLIQLMEALGMGSALVQKKDLERQMIEQVFALLLLFNLALFLLTYLTAPVIARFFEEPQLEPMSRVLGLQFLLISFSTVPDSLLRRDMRFRRKSIVVLISMVAHAAVTLSLAFSGFGVWALVLGQLAASLTLAVGLNLALGRVYRPRFDFTGMRSVIGFGSLVTAQRLLWYLYSQSDVFIIGKIMGKELLGFYAVAMQLATLPMQKIQGMLNEVGFAAFSRIQSDKEQMASHFLKAVRVLGFLAFPVFFGISSVAPEIVDVLLGEKWHPAILPLQVLSLIVPLRMVSNITTPALLGAGRAGVGLVNLVSACIIMPTAFLIGARWGLTGVAVAWVVAYPFQFLIVLYRSLPFIGVPMLNHLKTLQWPASSATLMYLTVVLTRESLNGVAIQPGLTLFLLIAVGAVTYLTTMYLLQRETFGELVALARA